jgi:hypothetical protein
MYTKYQCRTNQNVFDAPFDIQKELYVYKLLTSNEPERVRHVVRLQICLLILASVLFYTYIYIHTVETL